MKTIVKGKKFTILWHDDDIKTKHVYSNIVSIVISDIDSEYGKIEK